jgi:hypothetical protein
MFHSTWNGNKNHILLTSKWREWISIQIGKSVTTQLWREHNKVAISNLSKFQNLHFTLKVAPLSKLF